MSPSDPPESSSFRDGIAPAVEEYEQLLHAGCAPSPEEFAARYPDLAPELDEAVSMIFRLQQVAPQTPDRVGTETAMETSIRELAALRAGDRVLHFKIEGELGRGGMGIVFQAQDENLRRDVALKVIYPSMLRKCASITAEVDRFAAEARTMAGLTHENIVKVNGIHRWGATWFFDMELLSGAPLSDVLRQLVHRFHRTVTSPVDASVTNVAQAFVQSKTTELLPQTSSYDSVSNSAPMNTPTTLKLPTSRNEENVSSQLALSALLFDRAAAIAMQIAKAIQYAHREGMLHRDIKPANLMIDATLSVKVMDFGLATEATAPCSRIDSAGSLRYMAPERFHSSPVAQSDVYSVGVTLLELIAAAHGIPAEDTVRKSPDAESRFQPRKCAQELVPNCPHDLSAIIQKATKVDHTSRYGSAAELENDLKCFLNRQPISARRWSWLRQVRYFAENHRIVAGWLVAMVCSLTIIVPAWLETRSALKDSKTANENAAGLLSDLNESNAIYAVRSAQQLIDQGLHVDAVGGLSTLPPKDDSWDTAWLRQMGESNLQSFLALANGDWGILDAKVSPDQRRLCASTAGGQLCVWDLKTGLMESQLLPGRMDEQPDRSLRYLHYFEDRPENSTPQDWKDPCCIAVTWVNSRTLRTATLNGAILDFVFDSAESVSTDPPQAHVVLTMDDAINCAAFSESGDRVIAGLAQGGFVTVNLTDPLAPKQLIPGTTTAVSNLLTAACREEHGHQWLIGFRDGTVQAVTDEGLTAWSEKVDGPVWSLDTLRTERQCRIAVGGQSNEVRLMTIHDSANTPVSTWVRVPNVPITPEGVHLVAFNRHQPGELIAVDSLHRIIRIDSNEHRVLDVEFSLSEDQRYRQKRSLQRFIRQPSEFPECMRRSVTLCQSVEFHVVNPVLPHNSPESQDSRVLMFGGQNKSLLLLRDRRRERQSAARSVLKTQVGKSPRIIYCRADPDCCWACGSDGKVQILDVARDTVKVELNLAQYRPITICAGFRDHQDICAVLCDDGFIRCVRFDQSQLMLDNALELRNAEKLVSLACDAGMNCFAGVHRDGRLQTWTRLAEGELCMQIFSPDGNDPFYGTGQVSISQDGTVIAAGSRGQVVLTVFRRDLTSQFTPIRNLLDVAGDGVQAIGLSEGRTQGTSVCFTSDSLLRVRAHNITDPSDLTFRGTRALEFLESVAERFVPTSDNRRMALLQNNGMIAFLSNASTVLVSSLRSSFRDCCDLTFSVDQRWMVVADRSGQLERFDTQATAKPRTTPPQLNAPLIKVNWQSRPVHRVDFRSMPDGTSISHDFLPTIHFTPDGAWCFGIPLKNSTSGVPYLGGFLCISSQLKEPVQISHPDAWIDLRTIAMDFDPIVERPSATYRTVSASRALVDVYTGDLWFSRIALNGQVTSVKIDPDSNCGFNPRLTHTKSGQPVLFSFSYSPYSTVLHARGNDGTWKRQPVGHAGFQLSGVVSSNNHGWTMTGNCGRGIAAAPSRLIQIGDDLQWKYVAWPFLSIPQKVFPHDSGSVIVSTEIEQSNSLQTSLRALPFSADKVAVFPGGSDQLADAVQLPSGAMLCLRLFDGTFRLFQIRGNIINELTLPDLPDNEPRCDCVLRERMDGSVGIVWHQVSGGETPGSPASVVIQEWSIRDIPE